MKWFTTLLFLFITINLYSQSNATKKETVDWLKSRLDYVAQWNEKHYERLAVLDYDYLNDTLYYKVHYRTGNKTNQGFRVDAIPIRDINPDRIRIVNMIGNDGDMGIELYMNYGSNSIMEYYHDPIIGKLKLTSNMATLYFPNSVISTQGVNITERAETAIRHLIKLSGGIKEKF